MDTLSLEDLDQFTAGNPFAGAGAALASGGANGIDPVDELESFVSSRHTEFGKDIPLEVHADLKGLLDVAAVDFWEKNPGGSYQEYEKALANQLGGNAGWLKSNSSVRNRARAAYETYGNALRESVGKRGSETLGGPLDRVLRPLRDGKLDAEGDQDLARSSRYQPRGHWEKRNAVAQFESRPSVSVDQENWAKNTADFNEVQVPRLFLEHYDRPEEERLAILSKYKDGDPAAREMVKKWVDGKLNTDQALAKYFDEDMSKRYGAAWDNMASRALLRGTATFSSKIAGLTGADKVLPSWIVGDGQGGSKDQANLRSELAAGAEVAQQRTGVDQLRVPFTDMTVSGAGLEDTMASATDSLLTAGAGGYLGAAAGGSQFAAGVGSGIVSGLATAEDAYGRGLQRGFGTGKNLTQAGLQGTLEAGMEIVGNKVFGPGLERAFYPQVAKKVTQQVERNLLKRAADAGLNWSAETAKRVLEELPSEVLTSISQATVDQLSGMDSTALNPDALASNIADTVLQTIFQVGMSRVTAEPLSKGLNKLGEWQQQFSRAGRFDADQSNSWGNWADPATVQRPPDSTPSAAPTESPGAADQPIPTTNNAPEATPSSPVPSDTAPSSLPPTEADNSPATGEDALPPQHIPIGDRGITPARMASELRQFEPEDLELVLEELASGEPTDELLGKYGVLDEGEETTPAERKAFVDAVLADFGRQRGKPNAQNQSGEAPTPVIEPNIEPPAEAVTEAPTQLEPGKEVPSAEVQTEAPQAQAGLLNPPAPAPAPITPAAEQSGNSVPTPAKSIGKKKQPVDRDAPLPVDDAPDDKYEKIKKHPKFVKEYVDPTGIGTSAVVLRSDRDPTAPFAVKLFDTNAGRSVGFGEDGATIYFADQAQAEAYARSLTDNEDPDTIEETAAEPQTEPAKSIGKKETEVEKTRPGKVGDQLEAGQVVLTNTGRSTTPFPKLDFDSDRKTLNTVKRVDAWLLENAIAEAESRGDEFNARSFRSEQANNLPQASKDAMEEYIFGNTIPPAIPSILKPLIKPSQESGPATDEDIDITKYDAEQTKAILRWQSGRAPRPAFLDAQPAAPKVEAPVEQPKAESPKSIGKKQSSKDTRPAEVRVAEVVESISRRTGGKGTIVAPSNEAQVDAVNFLKNLYGVDAAIVKVEGSPVAGVNNRNKNVILLGDHLNETLLWDTAGHELAHNTGADLLTGIAPEIIEPFKQKYLKNAEKIVDPKLRAAYIEKLHANNDYQLNREGLAMLVGEFFRDEQYRNALKEKDPTLFKKILDAILNLFKDFEPKSQAAARVLQHLRAAQKQAATTPTKGVGEAKQKQVGEFINRRVKIWEQTYPNGYKDYQITGGVGQDDRIAKTFEDAVRIQNEMEQQSRQQYNEAQYQTEMMKSLAGVSGEKKPAKSIGKKEGPVVDPNKQALTSNLERLKKLAETRQKPQEELSLADEDEELYEAALDTVVSAVKAGVTSFKEMTEQTRAVLGDLTDSVMPYMVENWNNYKRLSKNEKMDTATVPSKSNPDTEEEASSKLANWVAERLSDPTPISDQEFFAKANQLYGGSRAEGTYGDSTAYDALERGVNQYLVNKTDPKVDAADAKKEIAMIEEISNRIPRHKGRTGNKDTMQQFSTPPAYAYLASWVANLSNKDTVLEPSAGAGGLVVPAVNSGAAVYGNEYDPPRAALLRELPVKEVFTEDAEYIESILKGQMPAPSVVVMNPPFSRAGHRMGDKMIQGMDLKHIDAAMEFLQPGGRLVAIVGAGLHGRGKGFEHWLADNPYAVRADLEIGRDIYKSHGTTFPTRLLVIDKTTDGKGAPKTGSVETLAEAVDFLNEVRDARAAQTQQQPAKSIGKKDSDATESGSGPGVSVQSPTGEVRPGTTTEGSAVSSEQVRKPTGAESGHNDGGRAGDSTSNAPQSGNAGGGRSGTGSNKAGGKSIGKTANRPGGQSLQQPAGISTDAAGTGNVAGVEVSKATRETKKSLSESTYESYQPHVKIAGAKAHPASLVESAAMAAINPPAITYAPKISPQVIAGYKTEDGTQVGISDVQLEAVAMAGQAHQTIMPNGERRGFMIGDGTGVGKAREAAGIIMDNVNQGRKKAVWISKNGPLFDTAKIEWKKVGGNADAVFSQEKIGSGEKVTQPEGILFTTYSRLSGEASDQAVAAGNKLSRLEQIIDWVGKDFDGVIIMDESHEMGSSMERGSGLSKKKASNKGLAGVDLQKELPNARVVYLSATSATEVENLAYATRLGLWGPGTAFPDRNKFMESIGKGGVAAMEKIAGDMKAMGMYLARNIAFDDGTEKGTVVTERMEHTLTESQRAAYDKMAEAWSIVFANMKEAMEDTGAASNGNAVGRARGAFWSANQRFWNQVITAMQTPSVIQGIERDLKNGKSVVIQLTNTNEAGQKRALAGMDEDSDLSEVDVSPRYILMDFIERSFPTTEYEEYIDENGNTRTRPVLDSKGNPVKNAKAEAKKQELLDQLGSLQVGNRGAMDMIIDHFGADQVAEITGRSERLVEVDGKTVRQKRTPSATKADSTAFMDGRKRILIFSEAGGTGQSYHADLSRKNQEQRIHYLLQAGWKADAAIQGLGRTHRSNQAHAPKYVLVHTDLKGQKRFISTIARRLAQLGALTKGQRQAGDSGVFNAADNLESTEAKDALLQFYNDAMGNTIEGIDVSTLENTLGLKMRDKDGNRLATLPPITQFMNRVLSLPIDTQNKVFDAFQERIDDKVNQARANGTLDQGLETIRADGIKKNSEQVVYQHETGAEAKHVVVTLSRKTKPKTWDEAQNAKVTKFVRSEASGKVWAVEATGSYDQDAHGVIDQKFRIVGPMGVDYKKASELKSDNWTTLEKDQAEREWNEMVEKSPPFSQEKKHLLTGVLLPVWDRLPENTNQVVRLLTDEGEQILGRVIPAEQVNKVLGKLGVHVDAPKLTPADAVREVLSGKTLILSNDWKIKRSKVQNEQMIEVIGPDYTYKAAIDRAGVFDRRLDYKVRYFIPMGGQAEVVMGKLTKSYPITDVRGSGENEIQAIYGGSGETNSARSQGGRPTEVRGVQKAPKTSIYQTFADKMRSSTQAKKDEAIAARDILKTWERIFDVPMRAEGFRIKADAIYNNLTQMVRFKNKHTANLAAKMHEVAHHIDNVNDITGKSNKALTPALRDELRQLDYAPKSHTKQVQLEEGFAEFIRHFVTERDAQSLAPNFYDWFTKTWMPANQVWGKALLDAKEQADKYASQGVFERVGSAIGAGPAIDLDYMEQLKENWRNRLATDYDNWVDNLRPLQLLDQAAAEGGINFDQRATAYEKAMVYSRSARAQAGRALDDGVHLLSHDRTISAPLWDVAKKELRNAMEYKEAVQYALARHLDWYWNNVNSKFEGPADPRDVKRILEETEADPDKKKRYEKVAISIAEFGNALLDMKVDAGASFADAERAKALYGNYYFPLLRVKDEQHKAYARQGTRFVNLSKTGMKKRTNSGSGEAIMDPFDAMVEKTIDAYSYATRKRVEQAIIAEADPHIGGAEGLGWLVDKVDPKTAITTGTIEEILRDLVKSDTIDKDQAKAMTIAAKIKRGEPLTEVYDKSGKNLTGGERKWFADKHGIDPFDDQDMEDAANEEPDAMHAIALYRNDFTPSAENATVLVYDRAGEPRLYQLDRRLYQAVHGMEQAQQPIFLGFLSAVPAALKATIKLMRIGAVSGSTIFGAKQLFSDYFQSLGRGGDATSPRYIGKMIAYKWRQSEFKVPFTNIKLKDAKDGGNALIRLWETVGGKLFTELGSDFDTRQRQRQRSLGLKAGTVTGRVRDFFSAGLENVQDFVAWTDAPPRLAAMEAKARELGYEAKGEHWYSTSTNTRTTLPEDVIVKMLYAASEATVNFKRIGNYMAKVNPWSPFLNASLQANYAEIQQMNAAAQVVGAKSIGKQVAGKLAVEKAKRMGIAYVVYLAASMAAGALEWWLRHEDEDWKGMDEDEKEKYFTWGRNGRTYLHIAKPRDLGGMLMNATSAALDNLWRGDEATGVSDVISRHAGGRMLRPTGPLMTLAELASGYDFHRQRRITPEYLMDNIKEKQHTNYTTPFAKSASQMLGGAMSPIEIDHMMNGFTGGAYRRLHNAGESIQQGTLGLKDLPFVGAVATNRFQHATTNRFYNELHNVKAKIERDELNGATPDKDLQAKAARLEEYAKLIGKIRKAGALNSLGRRTDETESYIHGLAREALGFEELEHSISPIKAENVSPEINKEVKKFVSEKASRVILSSGYPEKVHKGDKDYAETLANWKQEYAADLKWLKANKHLPKVQAVIDEVLNSESYRNILRGKDRPRFDLGNDDREAFEHQQNKYLERFETAEKIRETLGSKD